MNQAAAPVREQVEVEQLRMVWTHVRLGVLVATGFAVVLALALRGVVASTALVDGWLVLKVGISVFRVLQGLRFAARASPGRHWPTWTLAALIVDGAVWGAAGLYVITTAPWPQASFFVAVLACLSCVATFGLQISARFTAGYAVPILAPAIIGLFLRDELFGQLGGIGLLLLLGLQLATAARTQARIEEGIQLRLQAESLAVEKAEALKLAMRQSSVRLQFLANISHELRTPLQGILGMARLLHPAMKDPVLTRRVDLIESSGTHLLSLINDLLDLSRIDAGSFMIRPERHDLNAQIEQLAGIYAMRCEEKGLSFEVHAPLPTPCWVMVDPARFKQVLHNLLGNAVKFTRHGGVSLHITRDEVNGLVHADVRDTGPGIPPAELERIFEAFQQSKEASAVHMAEGAGLGLTIARDLARAMGGDVTASSQPGLGTTLHFTCVLPGTTAPAPGAVTGTGPVPDKAASPQPSVAATSLPRHCLALLAEDNDINALVAMNFLEIIGVDTERVKDGAEALRQATRAERRPDIVLMDCQMPMMSGPEAARQIRVYECAQGLPRVPILALTATASDAERQDCLDAGMDDFLAKPCTLEDLSHAILHWTADDRLTRADAPQAPPRAAGPHAEPTAATARSTPP